MGFSPFEVKRGQCVDMNGFKENFQIGAGQRALLTLIDWKQNPKRRTQRVYWEQNPQNYISY